MPKRKIGSFSGLTAEQRAWLFFEEQFNRFSDEDIPSVCGVFERKFGVEVSPKAVETAFEKNRRRRADLSYERQLAASPLAAAV